MDIDASASQRRALARITASDSPTSGSSEHRPQGIGVGWDLGSVMRCSPALQCGREHLTRVAALND